MPIILQTYFTQLITDELSILYVKIYKNTLADDTITSSVSEVRKRALISESTAYLSDDEYEQEMDEFLCRVDQA